MDKIINFISMFEQSIGLKDPWKVKKANFSDDIKAVHIYVSARKTAKYPCPECGKLCKRFDDEDDLSGLRNLCVDETSFRRGHKYVTIVSDADARRVIGVEEDRSMDSVERFSFKFEEKGGECAEIRAVSCDMSKAYLKAKEICFSNAPAVTDKFT